MSEPDSPAAKEEASDEPGSRAVSFGGVEETKEEVTNEPEATEEDISVPQSTPTEPTPGNPVTTKSSEIRKNKGGMPVIEDWRINTDKGISGRVFGHDGYPEGYPIETPEVSEGSIAENNIVSTLDGEKYKLGKPKLPIFGKPVPFTVEGVKKGTDDKLKANSIFSLYEKGLTHAPQDGNKFWASEKDATKSYSLRYGNFHFDEDSIGSFVFVPASFEFTTDAGFMDIVNSLGLKPPDLTFTFSENWGVVPNLDKEETDAYHAIRPKQFTENKETWNDRRDLKYPNPHRARHHKQKIELRVQNVLHALAEGCSESTAVFLLTQPHTGNILSEMACNAASRSAVASLGLFVAEDFSYVHEDEDDKGQFGREELFVKLSNIDVDEYLSADHQVPYGLYSSTHRWFHDPKTFGENPDCIVSAGESPSSMIKVTTKRTKQEASFYDVYRHQAVFNGLASRCSHRLVFEDRNAKNLFETMFLDKFPSGFLCVGSGNYGITESMKCLTNSRPLFVLKNTGATSNAVAELGYLGRKIFKGDFQRQRQDTLASSHRVPADRDTDKDIAFLPPEMQKKAHVLEDINEYIDKHFPPAKNSEEAMHHFFPDVKAAQQRDLGRELAIDDFVWDNAKVYAQTFSSIAPNFNPDAMEIFDVGVYIDVKELQNRITEVMSSSFDHLPELGGLEKDKAVLGQSIRLQKAIEAAKFRYRTQSNILQFLVRSTLLGTTTLTVMQVDLVDPGVRLYDVFTLINIILPLVSSLFITLDSVFRPTAIYASLLLAEQRIISERYRFLTRTGDYRIDRSQLKGGTSGNRGKRIREKFAAACQQIYDEVVKSDFSYASLFTTTTSRRHDEKVFGVFQEEDDTLKGDTSDDSTASPIEEKKKSYFKGMDLERGGGPPDVIDGEDASDAEGDVGELDTDVSAEVLKPEEYIEMRLKPCIVDYYRELPRLTLSRFYLRVAVISLTATSSAFAALKLEIWVPVVLAAAGTVEYGNQFFQLDTRVPGLNDCAGELTKIYLWWTGITLIQSRLASFKDQLVDNAEDAIVAQYEQYAGATLLLKKKDGEDKDKDKKKENEDKKGQ